jgi:predicted amidohydrolase YtcJ
MAVTFAPDMIVTNAKIITVDQDFSVAEAMAIYDGKVCAIGPNEQISEIAGPGTIRRNLGGRCVVPGQMDNHVHFILAGMDGLRDTAKVNIATSQSIDAILREIAGRAAITQPGEWIGTSCMYRGALADGRFPNRHDLDKVSTEHPIYIFQSGKNVIANSFALRLAGIDRNTPNPTEPEGWIDRDSDGEPTGHLIAGAADAARKSWWQQLGQPIKKWDLLYFDQETQIRAIESQQEIYHACGVVGVRDMGVSPDELEAYIEAHRQGRLKIRTDMILGLPARYLSTDDVIERVDSYFGPKQHLGDSMLKVGGIKLVVVNDGWWAYTPEKLRALIHAYNERGWNMAIHINTGGADDSTELVLDTLEEADKIRPIAGRRFSFEHGFGLARPEHIERAAALGAVIGSNALLAYYAAARSLKMNDVMDQVRIAKTSERDPWKRTVRDWGMPIADWLAAGLVVTGGSDNPAVVYDKERPFLSQYSALTGETMAGALLEQQSVSREQMLRMYTINNAYACWQEDIRGSLEVGKLADFVVLDRDLLECRTEEIQELKVLETFVGGEQVYERVEG